MITLGATLTAEQKKTNAVPYVELKAKEKIASANRFRWTRYYAGTGLVSRHAACMPADGSLLRAKAVQNGVNYDLSYARVASPGPSSNYDSWSTLVNNISTSAGFAFGANGTKVDLIYVDNGLMRIYEINSSDSGATYGAANLIDNAPANVTHLALVHKSATTKVLFYAAGGIIYHIVWTFGVGWGARAAWTNTATTITGLSVYYYQDYSFLLAGTNASGDAKVWLCLYGDGNQVATGVWSALQEVMSANTGTNITYAHTCLARPDVFRAIYVESYSGTGSYATPKTSHTLPAVNYIDNLWREPWPLNITSSTGVALAYGDTYVWLTTPNGVWRAEIAPTELDLTANLLSITMSLDEDGGKLTAVIRNDAGTYLETASGKGEAWIGTELKLGLGYRTSAGGEASTHLSFWVDAYELSAEPAKAQLTLTAVSPWELLDRWKPTRQISWAAGDLSITNLLKWILARAGFNTSFVNASGQLSTVMPGFTILPAFTIKPNESLKSALLRLMAMVTDGVRFQNATAVFTDRSDSDASAYAFGTTHVIKSAKYRSGEPLTPGPRPPTPNRVQVFVNGAFGQAHDWTQIELRTDASTQALFLNLTTAVQASTQASAILRQATIASKDDTILIPPHCGLEIHDVVDVTEARAGLSAAKRRVKAMTVTYETIKRKFDQQITLGGV